MKSKIKVGEITDICKFTLILVAEFDSRFVCHTAFLIKNFKKVVDQHTERIYHIREIGQEWSILRHRLVKNFTVLRHNKIISMASQMALMVKNPSAAKGDWEMWVWSLGQEDPLQEGMQPTPVSLPGESHGQRSLVGHSPWGRTESDTTGVAEHQDENCFLGRKKKIIGIR